MGHMATRAFVCVLREYIVIEFIYLFQSQIVHAVTCKNSISVFLSLTLALPLFLIQFDRHNLSSEKHSHKFNQFT